MVGDIRIRHANSNRLYNELFNKLNPIVTYIIIAFEFSITLQYDH